MKKFYIISLIYSIFGSLGLICFLNWFGIMAFNESRHYLRLIPFCEIVGLLSLIVCIINFFMNISILFKMDNPKWKVILKEFLIVIISFIPLLYMWRDLIYWLEIVF
ncbi:MAG: hypothetical protein ACI4WH_07915 [Oscillospiraceae bacterium]